MIIHFFCYLCEKKMKHFNIIVCPHCNCNDLVKNGHSENNTQRWLCSSCDKSFQLEYTYNAYNPGVKDKITELTMNSSGVMKFFRRGLFKLFPRVKIHYLELCLEGIPRRMSKNRYGNDELTNIYFRKIAHLLKTQSLNFIVGYLWDEFLKVNVVDVLLDLNTVLVALPNGTIIRQGLSPTRILAEPDYAEDVKELDYTQTDDSIIRMRLKTPNEIKLKDIILSARIAVATIVLFTSLNLTQLIISLKGINIFPNFGVYSCL